MIRRSVIVVPIFILPFSLFLCVYYRRRASVHLLTDHGMSHVDIPFLPILPSKTNFQLFVVRKPRILQSLRQYTDRYRHHGSERRRLQQYWEHRNRLAFQHQSQMGQLRDRDVKSENTKQVKERESRIRKEAQADQKREKERLRLEKEELRARREEKREVKKMLKQAKQDRKRILEEQRAMEREKELLRKEAEKRSRAAKRSAEQSLKEEATRLKEENKRIEEAQQREKKIQEMLKKWAKKKKQAAKLDLAIQAMAGKLTTMHVRDEKRLMFLTAKKARTDAELKLIKCQSEYYHYLKLYGTDHIFTQIKKRNCDECRNHYNHRKAATKKLRETSMKNLLKPKEILERSRLVLKWRAYRWTGGVSIGRKCDFDGNQCSLTAYCKLVPIFGWRCVPQQHVESVQHGTSIDGWQYNSRSDVVYRRVIRWTQAIQYGAKCTPDGPRCSLGLECKLVDEQKNVHVCLNEQVQEDVPEEKEKVMTETKFMSVLFDKIDVTREIDGIAKNLKYQSNFGRALCDVIYHRVARKCNGCRVLVLPLNGESFTLRIASVKFHANVYFSIFDEFVNDYGIWLYKTGDVDLDNRTPGNDWCIRE